jgi:hypothetical protein
MAGFVKPHKVIVKRNEFSSFPSLWNVVDSEGGIESEELKRQFSQVEGDLNLQEIPKPIPISNKRALRWNIKMKKLKRRPIVCSKSQNFLIKKAMNKGRKREKKPKVI